MIIEKEERWIELCELASHEQDAEKRAALIEEILRLLMAKQDGIVDNSLPDWT